MSSHGGKREGSGPKKPMSPYGEKTSVIRVPTSLKADVLTYLEAFKTKPKGVGVGQIPGISKALQDSSHNPLPIYSGKVSAGQSRFPSPAQDYELKRLDLNKHLIQNPPATYLFNVGNSYDSMVDVGILPGALLIVDRSITPKSSHIVLADVEGELIVKRLYRWRNIVELRSENKEKNYPPITFAEGQELYIWGVVTFNVNSFK